MADIYNVVVQHMEIDGINRYQNACARSVFLGLVLLDRPDFIQNNIREFLFKDIVSRLLQIFINCQVDVAARARVYNICGFQLVTEVVHIDSLLPLGALQNRFQRLFKSRFADDVRGVIGRICFLQVFELICRNLTGISQYLGKIFAVHIPADRCIFNIDAFQTVCIFQKCRNRLAADIRGNCRRHVALESIEA